MEIEVIPEKDGLTDMEYLKEHVDAQTACVLIQHPNYYGNLEEAATAAGSQIDPRSEYTSAGNDRRYPEYSRDGKSSRTAEICNYRCVKFTIAGNVSILPEILR